MLTARAEGKNSNQKPANATTPVSKLTTISQQLLNLRMGPGAAILPPEVSQIHMDFAMRTHNGHMGAKYAPPSTKPRKLHMSRVCR